MVATALAASTALSRETSGSPARICASDPTNASPAPVVSTTCSFSSLGHFTCVAPSGPQTRAPCAPMEISTCLQPLSWRTFAAAMASSSLLQGMPVRSSVSLWFGQMMSTSLYISSGRGTAGAGVSMQTGGLPPVPLPAFASRNACSVRSTEVSSCARITRAFWKVSSAPATSASVMQPLAPGTITMWFSPPPTQIWATPVDSGSPSPVTARC
mmetsp:Transcript_92774/g.262393  ORF Transcript_92774/g.262393 Transcript_92774/m.262393 type:complete len:213 (-) Transcript_92774:373-1011(-)